MMQALTRRQYNGGFLLDYRLTRRMRCGLYIEPEMHDVAILDNVLLAFDSHLAGLF